MKTEIRTIRTLKAVMKRGFCCVAMATLLATMNGCTEESMADKATPPVDEEDQPLSPGEVCTIGFTSSVVDIEQATTRSIPDGKRTVLKNYTNHRLIGSDGKEAGWISGEVRTEYSEEVKQAATRSFNPDTQVFGKNSLFRMLVFAGTYDAGNLNNVSMNSPIANMVCQVNSSGNGAEFVSPAKSLGLLKGNYTFVCFPADEKYNKWQVGSTTGYEIPIGKDEDFVYLKTTAAINTAHYKLDLSKFVRMGYQLTVKLTVQKELGYLLRPQKEVVLQVSDDGSGADSRVINTGATYNLKTSGLNYNGNTASFKDSIPVDKNAPGQVFTPVTNFLIANSAVERKLTIKYPQLTVMKPAGTNGSKEDSIFTIRSGTYTTTKPIKFEPGKSYTITLSIGATYNGIAVTFRNSTGAEKTYIFSPSQLWYNKDTKTWGWGKEQCDYGYVENNTTPGSSDMKLVNGTVSYYFMYGKPEGCIGTSTGGYYTGSSNLFDVNLDPCQKMGDRWISPTSEIIQMLTCQNDYHPIDQNGNRMGSYGPWSSYTPTDGRANKTAISGRWFNITSPSGTQYNSKGLFLPAGGGRTSNGAGMYSVGSSANYWISQPNGSNGNLLYFASSSCYLLNDRRNTGFTVRCCHPE